MNIYIHCEIVSRELDSKLLLAVLAASRGHQVVISDSESIEKGVVRGYLYPGIFHTKSITPGKSKIKKHSIFKNAGIKITSIDEEGGLTSADYNVMANIRYSSETFEDVSAIFTWGDDDYETLKKKYPNYISKIYKTGSPRADLWKSKFSDYWSSYRNKPQKPFLLVSSNMNVCDVKFFHERVKDDIVGGYYERDPEHFYERFKVKSNNFTKAAEFIKVIKHLSKNNNGYDIVLRPHPIENINCWKVLLEGIPNVFVNREGSINTWVHNSFAIMHNGCTTALEATILKKPVLTYAHPSFKFNKSFSFPNELGYLVENKEDLLNKVNDIFSDNKSNNQKYSNFSIPPKVLKRIFIDNNELSAKKMVKIWESLDDKSLSKPNNWAKFIWHLKKMKFNGLIGRIINFLIKNKSLSKKENSKFPVLQQHEIESKVNKLIKILGVNKKLDCKVLSDRTILIKLS